MESSTTLSTPTEIASASATATATATLPSSTAETTAAATTTTTITIKDDDTTQSHYTSHDTNNTYEDAFFYEPGLYMEYLKNLIQEKFGFIKNHSTSSSSSSSSSTASTTNTNECYTLVDIGGGTGNFTKEIIQNTCINAIVVDPYLIGTSNDDEEVISSDLSTISTVSFIKQPAEAYMMSNDYDSTITSSKENDKDKLSLVNWKNNYDYVLLKEVIHHLKECDRIPIFCGIYNGFKKTRTTIPTTTLSTLSTVQTKLIIITRPQYDIDYPLWEDAKNIWSQNQPSIDQILYELQQSNYTNIQYTIESYSCTIPFTKWEHMILQRCWSTFTTFTNEQLQNAIQQIRTNESHRINPINDTISFDDRLIIITASI